jgi:hypothetical protein
VATFGGVNIFGVGVEAIASGEPRRRQYVNYPNVDGLELVDLGGSGSRISVRGWVVVANLVALAGVVDLYRTLQQSTAVAALVDNDGTTYPYAVLEEYRPTSPIHISSDGYALRSFEWGFRSLT